MNLTALQLMGLGFDELFAASALVGTWSLSATLPSWWSAWMKVHREQRTRVRAPVGAAAARLYRTLACICICFGVSVLGAHKYDFPSFTRWGVGSRLV